MGPEPNQDQLSGFQKIRSAFSKFNDCRVEIDVAQPTSRSRSFIVHVKLFGLVGLISDEIHSSDR
jgi:hypothetical protein